MPAVGGLKIPIPQQLLDQARELYLAGKQWAEIEQITGVKASSVSRIASVKGWTATKAKAKEQAGLQQLTKASAVVRARLSEDLIESLQYLPKHSKSAKGFGARHVAIGAMVSNAKVVLGWSDGSGTTHIDHLNAVVLNQSTIDDVPTLPTIDVSPIEPVDPQPASD